MVRGKEKFLTQAYVITDVILIFFSFLLSWFLKFKSGLFAYDAHLDLRSYGFWTVIYTLFAVSFGYYFSLYTPKRKKRFAFEIAKVLQVEILSLLFLQSFLFLYKEVDISRAFLFLFVVTTFILVTTFRLVVKLSLKRLRKKGYNKQFILVLGAGQLGRDFSDKIQMHAELGYEIVGYLDDYQEEHFNDDKMKYKPVLGRVGELETVLEKNKIIDEVIIALPLSEHRKYRNIIGVCEKAGVKTMIIPDFYDYLPAQPYFDNFADIPVINVRDIPLDEWNNRFWKRLFDILFSLIAIIITSPIMLLIVAGIKISSPGPVLFRQERVGLNRRTFDMYKFRSMKVSDEQVSDTVWTTKNDPRKTRFGSFLRKTSLDELPQFFNVLKGDMSVVGPRPERPYFVDQFKEEIPKYMVKHHVRPGITGWAQANGLRGDTSIEDRIVHDIFYIENWTLLFDMKIIWKTIVNGIINKNAY